MKREHPFKVGNYAAVALVSERQARRDLAEMESHGLVRREGAGPATTYSLIAGAG